MTLLRRTLIFLALICLGCSAQSAPPDTVKAIQRQVRGTYNLPPTVKVTVGALKPSEFPGYDQVPITLDGGESTKQYDFLLSKDHKTMFRLTKFDLTKDPYAELMKKIDVQGRPTRGNKQAKVVAVNYDDFECPFCSHMHQNLFPGIFKEYGDRVLFIYKDFPLVEIHPWATHAAVDANCLAAQNADAYWAFADYVHSNQEELKKEKNRDAQLVKLDQITVLQGQRNNVDLVKLQSCIKAQKDDAVKASMKEAEGLGVNATPTMFVNGEKVDGAVSTEELRAVLDRALTDAGVAVPMHPAPASASQSTPSAQVTGK